LVLVWDVSDDGGLS